MITITMTNADFLLKEEHSLIVNGAKTQPYGFGVLPASCFKEDLTFLNVATPIFATQ